MRLFVAVDLTEVQRQRIKSVQKQLRLAADGMGRFPAADTLHMTLAFIGEYDPKAVISALSGCRFSPFTVCTGGLGRFGSTCFLSVSSSGALEKLACDVRRALEQGDIPFDKKGFVPHITLARDVPKHTDLSLVALPYGERLHVDCFRLYRSELLQGKRTYTPLFTLYGQPDAMGEG